MPARFREVTDVEQLLASLTLDEKASLTCGADMWTVPGVERLGVPAVTVTDGPNGARGSALLGAGRVSAACVPCGSALGASWDPRLVAEVGAVLGEEARTKSARVLLGPTVNIVRSPLAGRTFECYSEDPLLSGRTAAGFVTGVQSRGVAATVKHYLGNEAEHERTTISSDIDERALREVYLVPFEHAVAAGVHAVMTSYNRVNGRWVSEDPELLRVLREDLGFTGVVMTDWFAVGSTVGSALAGLDLQMPGPARFFGAPLADAVRRGDVPEAVLDGIARRWLQLVDRLEAWADQPAPERAVDLPEHRAVARRAAAESTVLLRNDGLLPLSGKGSVALIGPNAERAHIMGGGSAQLRAHDTRTLAEVLGERCASLTVEPGCVIDRTVRPLAVPFGVTFAAADGTPLGSSTERDGRLLWFDPPAPSFTFTARAQLPVTLTGRHRFTLVQAGRARVRVDGQVVLDGTVDVPPPGTELFGLGSVELEALVELTAGRTVEVEVEYSSEGAFVLHGCKVGHRPPEDVDLLGRAVAAAAAADVAVVVVGTSDEWETEGEDRASFQLPGDQDELVRRVCAANPRTVVVVNAGAPVQMDWADDAAAVLVPWLGGEEMAEAVADVLLGVSEPAGRLPVTVPLRIEHSPAYGAFPGSNHHVGYTEGLLVGYRWYDTRRLPTRFPFGHGLSYTTFAWSDARATAEGVELRVTNTGDRRGAEVVQVYVEPPAGSLFRPRRELRAFAKVWLEPGESRDVRLALDERAFCYWDPGSTETTVLAERLGDGVVVPAGTAAAVRTEPGWYEDAGEHLVHLGRSVDDVVATLSVVR